MEYRLKHITFRMTLTEYKQLQDYAKRNSMLLSDVIRNAVLPLIKQQSAVKNDNIGQIK